MKLIIMFLSHTFSSLQSVFSIVSVPRPCFTLQFHFLCAGSPCYGVIFNHKSSSAFFMVHMQIVLSLCCYRECHTEYFYKYSHAVTSMAAFVMLDKARIDV